MGKIIVVGNEKGGTGKSTIAIHLITCFLHQGLKVASVDTDGRQGTLTHYIENRSEYAKNKGIDLPLPEHLVVTPQENLTVNEQLADEFVFGEKMEELASNADYVIIDTPGSNTHLFRSAHVYADVLVTPLNDSLIDLDVLARIDTEKLIVKAPSHYAQLVWRARQRRLKLDKDCLEWYVLRNRMMHISSRNERLIHSLLDALGKRIQFTCLPGIGERVILREMFLKGITVFDLDVPGIDVEITPAYLAARDEIRQVIEAIK